MTQTISIITPVYGDAVNYLQNAYQSLLTQQLPDGWKWQWVVQEDGQLGIVDGLFADDPRVTTGSSRHGGAGIARTIALSRAEGEYIKVLDADDQLPEGTLNRDIELLSSRPNIGWTTSRVLDLLPDGSTVGFDLDPPSGLIERGAVLRHWLAHDWRAQVHPATLCVRRDLLFAVGGWMALPASEDTGLLLALDAVAPGWFIEQVGLLYRKWPGQSTSGSAYASEAERIARMTVIRERAQALARFFPTTTSAISNPPEQSPTLAAG